MVIHLTPRAAFTLTRDSTGKLSPMDFPAPLTGRLCRPTLQQYTMSSINIPREPLLSAAIDDTAGGPSRPSKRQRTSSGALGKPAADWEGHAKALREWVGLVAIGAKEQLRFEQADEDESWGVEECEEGDVIHLSWTGFFHPKIWTGILDKLLEL